MKHSASKLSAALSVVFALCLGLQTTAKAQGMPMPADSIEVSLLTCAPQSELYSLYGHTAIRVNDMRSHGMDMVFNYGVFNFNKPHFALRFALGKTDYELGIVPWNVLRLEYQRQGREVVEQVIDLDAGEKQALIFLLWNNYRPENRLYRYNFFYDNCTTRARDMLEQCINGHVAYAANDSGEQAPTYRQLLHKQLENHRWAAFADDLCLGVGADRPIDWRGQQFLPAMLMHDFATATIEAGGHSRPLVAHTRTVVEGSAHPSADYPVKPIHCALVLLAITTMATVAERRCKMAARALDTLLVAAQGLAGIVVAVLLCSEHPTTSTNLQALLLNPLPLLFLPSVARGRKLFWKVQMVLVALFMAGSLFQCYAEGMGVVALCLLMRCCAHLQTTLKRHLSAFSPSQACLSHGHGEKRQG